MSLTSDLHILLVEDDRLLALDMGESLNEAGYSNLTVLHSAEEAILYLSENPLPDVALLDIDLGKDKRTGFDVANLLNRLGTVLIVFWTGKGQEFLPQATLTPHALFAEKSTSPKTMAHNIGRLAQRFENQRIEPSRFLFLPYQYETYHKLVAKVKTVDIIFVEADQKCTDFYTLHRPFKGTERSLVEFGDRGQFPSFFRIHKSFVINVDSPAVKGFNGSFVLVEFPFRQQRPGGTEVEVWQSRKLPVSRRRRAAFSAFWSCRR